MSRKQKNKPSPHYLIAPTERKPLPEIPPPMQQGVPYISILMRTLWESGMSREQLSRLSNATPVISPNKHMLGNQSIDRILRARYPQNFFYEYREKETDEWIKHHIFDGPEGRKVREEKLTQTILDLWPNLVQLTNFALRENRNPILPTDFGKSEPLPLLQEQYHQKEQQTMEVKPTNQPEAEALHQKLTKLVKYLIKTYPQYKSKQDISSATILYFIKHDIPYDTRIFQRIYGLSHFRNTTLEFAKDYIKLLQLVCENNGQFPATPPELPHFQQLVPTVAPRIKDATELTIRRNITQTLFEWGDNSYSQVVAALNRDSNLKNGNKFLIHCLFARSNGQQDEAENKIYSRVAQSWTTPPERPQIPLDSHTRPEELIWRILGPTNETSGYLNNRIQEILMYFREPFINLHGLFKHTRHNNSTYKLLSNLSSRSTLAHQKEVDPKELLKTCFEAINTAYAQGASFSTIQNRIYDITKEHNIKQLIYSLRTIISGKILLATNHEKYPKLIENLQAILKADLYPPFKNPEYNTNDAIFDILWNYALIPLSQRPELPYSLKEIIEIATNTPFSSNQHPNSTVAIQVEKIAGGLKKQGEVIVKSQPQAPQAEETTANEEAIDGHQHEESTPEAVVSESSQIPDTFKDKAVILAQDSVPSQVKETDNLINVTPPVPNTPSVTSAASPVSESNKICIWHIQQAYTSLAYILTGYQSTPQETMEKIASLHPDLNPTHLRYILQHPDNLRGYSEKSLITYARALHEIQNKTMQDMRKRLASIY